MMDMIRLAQLTGLSVALALVAGCRADLERGEAKHTVVVRDATSSMPDSSGYDTGDRDPRRIDVVVSDPRGGGGSAALGALVGRNVRVQFRRDMLGVAAPAPIPPTGQGPGGRAVNVSGSVRSVPSGWLVLERDNRTVWVPLASILLIEVTDAPSTLPAVE